MDKALFKDLVDSVKQSRAIVRGEAKPSRVFVREVPAIDARIVRESTGLSQSDFAQLMRVSIKTLQNWEQHRRSPTGPILVAAQVAITLRYMADMYRVQGDAAAAERAYSNSLSIFLER